MIHLDDIHSLTEFARNTKAFAKKLKKTGRPVVLTVNGRVEFVVQEAHEYQHLLNMAQTLKDRIKLDQAFDDVDAGRLYGLDDVEKALGLKPAGTKRGGRS